MNVLFAPDWRDGNPYQALLANALESQGIHVSFLAGYSRVLPLTRGTSSHDFSVFHLHWPEAYFPQTNNPLHAFLRENRFKLDLSLACRRGKLVTTAHNLLPHWGTGKASYRRNMAHNYGSSHHVIAHSQGASKALQTTYGVRPDRISVIPHGDLSAGAMPPVPKADARATLPLPPDLPIVLMFGAASEYKGIEEAIGYWQKFNPPSRLAIVGKAQSPEYANALTTAAANHPNIHLQVDRFLTEQELQTWLAAADVCFFNYRRILTSGSAIHARALGIPVLMPARLSFVDLGEPDPTVIRFSEFDHTFAQALSRATDTPRDYEAAASYRESIRWDNIASAHAEVYRNALATK